MNILVSNHNLVQAGGTESFTYTLIGELIKQGHEVEYFCFNKGMYSDRIERDLNVRFKSKKKYDLVLANHNTTVDELNKCGFTIQTCHGIYPKLEQPSNKARGYVSISQEVQNHLLNLGFPSRIIYNGIDCERFKPNKELRSIPKVLSMCHSAEAHGIVAAACRIAKLEFGTLDKYKDNAWKVEKIVNEYDLVIGLGRTAYEALACGRPVIIFDKRAYMQSYGDGYFLEVMLESLKNNCSGRALKIDFSPESLALEMQKYNPGHGNIARRYSQLTFNIKNSQADYINYHSELILLKQKRKIVNRIKETSINKLVQLRFIFIHNLKRIYRFLRRLNKSYS